MNFRAILAAAAFTVALPFTASASVIHTCGPDAGTAPYDIATFDTYLCELAFSGADATDGEVRVDFIASEVPLGAIGASANLGGAGTSFESATLQWFESDGTAIGTAVDLVDIMFGTTSIGFGGVANTSFDGPEIPDEQYILLTWTGFVGGNPDNALQVSIQVNAVPVPAGILLMGTALAGFGVMRRRKKAA